MTVFHQTSPVTILGHFLQYAEPNVIVEAASYVLSTIQRACAEHRDDASVAQGVLPRSPARAPKIKLRIGDRNIDF